MTEEDRNSVLEILSTNSYLTLNKKLLAVCGPEITVYLGNLVDKYKYFLKKNMITEDGGFYLIHEDQTAQTGMTEYQLRRCKKILKDLNLLRTEKRGIPSKEFYFLNFTELKTFLNDILDNNIRPTKIVPQDLRKSYLKTYENRSSIIKENEYNENEYKKSIFNNILNSGSDDDSTGKPVIAGKPVVDREDPCIDSKRPGSSNDDPCGSTNHNQFVSESEHFLTSKKVGTLTLKRTKFSHDDDNATTSRKRDGVVTMSMKDKVVSSAKKDRKMVFDPDPDIVAIINYWNTLPNAVKHKGDYSSKTFKSIYSLLYNLLNGCPLQKKKNGQPTKVLLEFFQRNNIAHALLTKRWTKEEICQVLKRISEDAPDDKLSLNAVLWNRFGTNGAFSKFLIIADRGSVGKVFIDMASKLADVLCPTISSTKREFWGKSFEELSKSYSVEEINRVLDWYVNNRDYKYVKKVKNAYEFCEYFDKIKKSMEVKLKEEQPQEDGSSMRGCVSKLLIAHGKTADFADMFYDKIFSRASMLLTKGSKLELCRKLVDLYNYIDDQQRSIKNEKVKNVIPGAFQALVRYIDWLTENKWVTDISPKVFDPESKLFYKFRIDDAETHLGYDLLTGEMYV